MTDVSDPAGRASWEEVRSDKVGTNWAVLALSTDCKVISFKAKGDGGLDQLASYLADSEVNFGYLRVQALDDFGSRWPVHSSPEPLYTLEQLRIPTVCQFLSPVTVPSASPPLNAQFHVHLKEVERSQVVTQSHLAEQVFSASHLALHCTDRSELTSEMVRAKLEANCGAHKPTGYEFGRLVLDDGTMFPAKNPVPPLVALSAYEGTAADNQTVPTLAEQSSIVQLTNCKGIKMEARAKESAARAEVTASLEEEASARAGVVKAQEKAFVYLKQAEETCAPQLLAEELHRQAEAKAEAEVQAKAAAQ
eukprot:gene897-2568_t